jgi:hypothetical protein
MVTGPPSALPVASPKDVIDAIEESELFQTTDDVMSFPKLSTALYCTSPPIEVVRLFGVTVIEVTVVS